MSAYNIEELQGRLSILRQNTLALLEQTKDFPAMQCNCQRALASLKMMEIDLGLVTVPLGAK